MNNSSLSRYASTLVLVTNARGMIEDIWPEDTLFFKNSHQWIKQPLQNLIVTNERTVFNNTLKNLIVASSQKTTIKTFLQNEKGKKYAVELVIQKIKKNNITLQFVFTVQNIQPLQNKTKSFPVELLLREGIINNVHAIIVILDPNGNINYLNKAGEQITGYPLKSVLQQNWFKIFVPKNEQAKALQIFKKLKRGKQAIDFENTILSKKKQHKTIQWKNAPIFSDNNFKGILSMGIDISELKNTTIALQQSEHKFKSLTEAIPVGISFCNTEGKFYTSTKRLQKFLVTQVKILKP